MLYLSDRRSRRELAVKTAILLWVELRFGLGEGRGEIEASYAREGWVSGFGAVRRLRHCSKARYRLDLRQRICEGDDDDALEFSYRLHKAAMKNLYMSYGNDVVCLDGLELRRDRMAAII
ncbi:hypothetical protein IEQ34_012179 [Dendrobium chrysotoxum]|uniref:Uncharacterized protein n=1 Tax=Dendrobium chrysotoxum TaxID=161865 RepID=A0AAV7GVV8_DENCH|nr:hypothetical protein IEQ34_012179 [Dendrobium chrysotoxum]